MSECTTRVPSRVTACTLPVASWLIDGYQGERRSPGSGDSRGGSMPASISLAVLLMPSWTRWDSILPYE